MKKLPIIISAILLISSNTAAQQATQAAPASEGIPGLVTDPMNYLILFTIIILVSTILVMARTIKLLIWQIAGAPKSVEKPVTQAVSSNKSTFWTRLNQKLSDAVPVEKEADVLLDHDYDGIKELDNNLPPWWKYGFYLTIIFAFIYLANYHVAGSGNVQLDEYNDQLAEAEIQKSERLKLSAGNVDETNVIIMTSDTDISTGQKIYSEKCLVCHGKAGEGLVGPNLTDDYWIHGGAIADIFKIIKYGFPSKGMLSWQGQLTPIQIQQVSSYVKSIKGTNPPNAKEPQGDLYQDAGNAGSASASPADSTVLAVTADSTTTKQ